MHGDTIDNFYHQTFALTAILYSVIVHTFTAMAALLPCSSFPQPTEQPICADP